jgi:hypothetical protein
MQVHVASYPYGPDRLPVSLCADRPNPDMQKCIFRTVLAVVLRLDLQQMEKKKK